MLAGASVTLRALRPEDGEVEQRFLRGLSFHTKYLRFLHGVGDPSQRMLAKLTQLDYDRELAIVALSDDEGADGVIGVGRYVGEIGRRACEFAVVVADAHQGRGIGHHIVSSLIDAARAAGFERMYGDVLASNDRMLTMVRRLGFEARTEPGDGELMKVERSLR